MKVMAQPSPATPAGLRGTPGADSRMMVESTCRSDTTRNSPHPVQTSAVKHSAYGIHSAHATRSCTGAVVGRRSDGTTLAVSTSSSTSWMPMLAAIPRSLAHRPTAVARPTTGAPRLLAPPLLSGQAP